MDEASFDAPRRRGLLGVGIVFVLGIVFGAALAVVLLRFAGGPPGFGRLHDGHGRFMNRMARELDLDSQQQVQIREILSRSQSDVHAVLERAHEEIRSLLRPEQREKFERLHPPRPPFPHRGPGER